MTPPLSDDAGTALDRALDRLRIRLLATAATRQQTAEHPPAEAPPTEHSPAAPPAGPSAPAEPRCHSTGAPRRTHQPRDTGTAA